MELQLKGKVAIITGGSKGIGLAIKEALEKEGVNCISWSRSEGSDLMRGITLPQYMQLLQADILINNVGGGGTWTPDSYLAVMFKNYGITNRLVRTFLNHTLCLKRVITISSIFGKEKGENPEFVAAKAAQIAFMKCLAGKYKDITFNTICPGYIDVGKQFPNNPKIIGKPEDVANIVTFLCSDLAKHINGACITVDGGESNSF